MGRPKLPRRGTVDDWREIIAWREGHGLTQSEMAEILGLTDGQYRGHILALRRGSLDGPPVTVVERFASYKEAHAALETNLENEDVGTSVPLTELLYFDYSRKVYAPVPRSLRVVRCRNPRCENGRPVFAQAPTNKIYCTPLCGKRHRRKR